MPFCRECGKQIEESGEECPNCDSTMEEFKPFSLERNTILRRIFFVSVVLSGISFVLASQSYMSIIHFNPEEHIVHQKFNGTNEFEFNTSDEIQYFGVYVKGDVECKRMASTEIDIHRGLIGFTKWSHSCWAFYDTDEYTYVGYVDLTTEKAGEYNLWGDFDRIVLVDHGEIPQLWPFLLLATGAFIGFVMAIVSSIMERNNAKNKVVNESGKTKVDNTRQRVPTNYKKVDFWGPNKPRKK